MKSNVDSCEFTSPVLQPRPPLSVSSGKVQKPLKIQSMIAFIYKAWGSPSIEEIAKNKLVTKLGRLCVVHEGAPDVGKLMIRCWEIEPTSIRIIQDASALLTRS